MKKTKSTFKRVMSEPKQKKAFEKEYADFLLSEELSTTKKAPQKKYKPLLNKE